jgi:hypothetical protein
VPRLDPHFERISRRLTTLELRQPDPGEEGSAVADGSMFGRVPHRFVDTYTARGIRTVIHEYGLEEKMAAQGLGDFELRISEEDPFRHRLELLVLPDGPGFGGDGEPGPTHIMDLRLHLSSVALPGVQEHADVVIVDWLLMQNPRRSFTRERPRLPGQRYPGTGLGRDVAQLLVIMCRRLGREGLLTVPERYHLAELYAKGGWRAPAPEADRDLDAVIAATRDLSLAGRAWALERGFITDEDGEPVTYAPHERVFPVSPRLERAMAPGGFLWLARLLSPVPRLHVDLEGLRASLIDEPVEGMDPDELTG